MNQANAETSAPDEKQVSPQPAGYIFSKIGLLVLLGFLLLAAWNQQIVIVVLLGLVLSAAGFARLWSKFCLVGVECQRTLSEPRVFPGEQVELNLRLSNRKILPLPWVQLTDQVPDAIVPAGPTLPPADRPGCRALGNAASLPWYTSIKWRYTLDCRKRGYYRLGPMNVSSGDIFGFYPRVSTRLPVDHIIVYPAIYPVTFLDVPSLFPIGETRSERRIFEDPSRVIGVRDYSPSDSLRRIHWKASARHGELQVKVFEPTTTLTVALFLAVDSFSADNPDDFELGVSAAASVANFLVQKRSPVGLFANTQMVYSGGQPVRMLPGTGLTQLVNILESLAKTIAYPNVPFAEFLEKEWTRLPWGTTIVLVVSRPPATLPTLVTRIRAAGCKVLVLQIGGPSERADYANAWYNVRSPGDLNELRPGAAA